MEPEGCKLVAVVKLIGEYDVIEDDCLADQLLEALDGFDSIQSATLITTAANCPDTFAICRCLFTVDIDGLAGTSLPCIGAKAAQSLITHGYVVIDGFLPTDIVDGVASLADASLGVRDLGQADGIHWRTPEPRDGRKDVAVWVSEGSRPASDAVFAEHVLPLIDALNTDMKTLMAGLCTRTDTRARARAQ